MTFKSRSFVPLCTNANHYEINIGQTIIRRFKKSVLRRFISILIKPKLIAVSENEINRFQKAQLSLRQWTIQCVKKL